MDSYSFLSGRIRRIFDAAGKAADETGKAADAVFNEAEKLFDETFHGTGDDIHAHVTVAGGVCVTSNDGHVVITGPVKSLRINDQVVAADAWQPPARPGGEG